MLLTPTQSCGEANMYMEGFRCNVTGATSNTPVSRARAPVWCEDDQSNCVKGAKQMVYWNQLEGNNVVVSGFDLSGNPKSPGYNMKMGFENGEQRIYEAVFFMISLTTREWD